MNNHGGFRRTLFAALALLVIAASVPAQSGLKDFVALVEANPYPETRNLFRSLAGAFQDRSPELARFVLSYSEGGGFGTGWIYVAPDGENYLITNQHVVAQAGTVTIKFEQEDLGYAAFADAPIVYVDPELDLAVVQFPDGARVFSEGFPLDTSPKEDGTQLFSAGFPGFGGQPLWQFSAGIVTNARARPSGFAGYDYVIQHSAEIDPGNSGGPLMVRDERSPTGFAVIGVNTWKANQRSNTNFAIPAGEIPGLIERARAANAVRAEPERMETELERAASTLASELASPNADTERIARYISYALVGRRGWDAFQATLDLVSVTDGQTVSWQQAFFSDPIETMRTSLYYQLWFATGSEELRADTSYDGIAFSDQGRAGELEEIRTRFTLGGRSTEISWSWEYGGWKIRDFELPHPGRESSAGDIAAPGPQTDAGRSASTPSPAPAGDRLFVGGRIGIGVAASGGAVYDYADFPRHSTLLDDPLFSWSIGAVVDLPLLPWLRLETGVSASRRGRSYQIDTDLDGSEVNDFWIEESIVYVSVPAVATYAIPLEPGLAVELGAGPALNVAVARGGRYWDWDDTERDLPGSWYGRGFPSTFALSLVLRAGVSLAGPTRVFGVDLSFDQHLTRDYDYGVDETARLRTLRVGTSIRIPLDPR